MINLMSDIRSDAGGSVLSLSGMDSSAVITVDAAQTVFDPIEDNISDINHSCNRIQKLYNIKRTGLPSEQKDALKEVDSIMLRTTPVIQQTRRLLENLKANSAQHTKKKTNEIMFQNKFNSLARNYQSAITRYQDCTELFRETIHSDFTRQARIVDPEISSKQIQEMLQSKDPAQYLQTHVMAISPNILDEVVELEEEHERVKKLEQTIKEIQELFNACAVLVYEAGEKLDKIELNVEQTLEATEQGKQELKKAEIYKIRTRKTKIKIWLLTSFCCIVLVAVLVVFLLRHFGILDF